MIPYGHVLIRHRKRLLIWTSALLVLFTLVGFFVVPPILKSVLTTQLTESPPPRGHDQGGPVQSVRPVRHGKRSHGQGTERSRDVRVLRRAISEPRNLLAVPMGGGGQGGPPDEALRPPRPSSGRNVQLLGSLACPPTAAKRTREAVALLGQQHPGHRRRGRHQRRNGADDSRRSGTEYRRSLPFEYTLLRADFRPAGTLRAGQRNALCRRRKDQAVRRLPGDHAGREHQRPEPALLPRLRPQRTPDLCHAIGPAGREARHRLQPATGRGADARREGGRGPA